jgi:hypothetical protein
MVAMAVLRGRTCRFGALFLVLWVCGPCGPLFDRFFVERFPDHGHLYAVGYHPHGFQLAYAGVLPAGQDLALRPDGAVMAELKAAAAATLGLAQLLSGQAPSVPAQLLAVRLRPEPFRFPDDAPVFSPDPPPRPEPSDRLSP